MEKVILAVTGASGAIYARKVAELLVRCDTIRTIAVVFSRNGRAVMEYERESLPQDPRMQFFDDDDLFAPPASGSARYGGMIVAPCTVGSAGRMAAGVSEGLIGRAADVMLKERRPLVLVVREMPLGAIHLRNLALLAECGASIVPACPSFYSRPAGVEELCATVADKAVSLLGLPTGGFEWGGGAQ